MKFEATAGEICVQVGITSPVVSDFQLTYNKMTPILTGF